MRLSLMSLSGIILVSVSIMAFVAAPQQTKPWIVPDNYKSMKNPVEFDKAAAAALYTTHCKSCHGKEGLGDGTKAAQLDTPSGDFTSDEFQSQSDGSLFYKTLKGRDDMPSYEKKIPDPDDIWLLVHYMRYLGE